MSVQMFLTCQSIEHDTQNPKQGSVLLRTQYDKDSQYNEYFVYTPSAQLNASILNESAFKQFIPGKVYKITIEQVE